MKKLLLISFLAVLSIACSTDSEDIDTANSAQRAMQLEAQGTQGTSMVLNCFSGLEASTFISTVNGLSNPTITFISNPPASATGSYKVKVEIEELGDCENLTSGTGNIRTFTTGATYSNVYNNPPQISGIKPTQIFMCYRWRMKFENVNRYGETTCTSCSPWYDAPLF